MSFRAQIQTQIRGLSWIGSQVRLSITSSSIPFSAFPSPFPRSSTSLFLPLSPSPPPRLGFAVVGARDRHRLQPAPQRLHRYNDCYGHCYRHCPQRRYQRQRVVDPRLSKPLISAVSASHPVRIAQAQSQAATPSSSRSNKLRSPLTPRIASVFSNPANPHLRLPKRRFSSSSTATTMPVGTVLVTGYDPSSISHFAASPPSRFFLLRAYHQICCAAMRAASASCLRRDAIRCEAMRCDAIVTIWLVD